MLKGWPSVPYAEGGWAGVEEGSDALGNGCNQHTVQWSGFITNQDFISLLKLRLALDNGVTCVAVHCVSEGDSVDTDPFSMPFSATYAREWEIWPCGYESWLRKSMTGCCLETFQH